MLLYSLFTLYRSYYIDFIAQVQWVWERAYFSNVQVISDNELMSAV